MNKRHFAIRLLLAGTGLQIIGQSYAVAASQSIEPPEFVTSKPESLQPYFMQLYKAGDRNAVLNLNRLGVAALVNQEFAIAEKAFGESIERIETMRTAGADLKAAKSKFKGEASKDFKGEPYEKGMAYYYRGLLYLRAGDFSNAGASFAQVNVEDTVAENETYQADYASMKLLNAWTLHCLGEQSTSADLYRQALEMNSGLSSVDYKNPSLVIAETGVGPEKISTGQYQEKLSWSEPLADASAVNASLNGQPIASAVRAENLYSQASTRGGRPIEYILAGKAKFKAGAETAAAVSGGVALVAMQTANLQAASGNYDAAAGAGYAAAGAMMFSLISKAVEKSTTPAADTRAWESLPGSIWLGTAKLESKDLAQVSVSQDDGAATRTPVWVGNAGACSAAWTRLSDLPPLREDQVEKIDKSKEAQERLKQFQAQLPESF